MNAAQPSDNDAVIRRRNTAAVKAYLEYLAQPKQRGRNASPANIRNRLEKVDAELDDPNTDVLRRLELIETRRRLEEQLETLEQDTGAELEAEFIEAIRDYAERKGISYATLRSAGVPASVLRRAGVKSTSRTQSSS